MKVLVSDKLANEAIEVLRNAGLEVDVKTGMSPEELEACIGDYDAIVIRSATKVRKNIMIAGKKLKAIGRAGVGLDNVDLEYAKEKGIKVFNTPAATSISVAELVIGQMLACIRNIPRADATMKECKWAKKQLGGTELYGKTLGILGIGRIGQEVAKRALAFGMKCIAYDPYITKVDLDVEILLSLEEVYKQADFITLHMPLLDSTKYLINKDAFAKMKDGIIIINSARGGVIKESDLLEALNTDKIRCVAIDVWEKEPTDNDDLRKHPKVIATPHLGASAKEGQIRAGTQVAEQIINELKG